MLGEIIISALIGLILGLIASLLPGIHSNTISAMMIAVSPALLSWFQPISIAIIIVSMGVSQSFLECIPSIFLGAPDADTVLSILPGHRLLLEGNGCEAVLLSAAGCFFALLLSIAFAMPTIWLFTKVYPLISHYIGWLILIAVIYLISMERKLWAVTIFIASGILGYFVLNIHMLKEPLLPLLSGLFGVSMLLLSMETNTKIPKQNPPKLKLDKSAVPTTFLSAITGWLCAFLPGLGPSQGAMITSGLSKNEGKSFLYMMGGISSANFAVSLITLYAIGKARNGAVVAMSRIVSSTGAKELVLFLSICLFIGGISVMLASPLSLMFSRIVEKVNYKWLCMSVIGIMFAATLALSGFLGLLVLFASTSLGILANIIGVRKSNMMGCLLVPVMIYFLI